VYEGGYANVSTDEEVRIFKDKARQAEQKKRDEIQNQKR
jgi:hypothetical protein